MCTNVTEKADIFGAAKGPEGWFSVDTAVVYFDHPFTAKLDHSLNIDFVNESEGRPTRVAIEISADSARALALRILSVVDNPESLAVQSDQEKLVRV
jgi:hypothetical protein